MRPIMMAWLSLIRRPLSTGLAVLAIALAVGGCGVLLRLYLLEQNRFSTLARGSDAIIGAKAGEIDILLGALGAQGAYPGFLPYQLFVSMRARQTVQFSDGSSVPQYYLKQVTPFLYCGLIRTSTDDFRLVATDHTFFEGFNSNLHFASGGFVDQSQSPPDVVLGSLVAKRLGVSVGQKLPIFTWVGQKSSGPPHIFRISGILRPTHTSWDRLMYTDLIDGQNLIAHEPVLLNRSIWGNNVVNYMLVDLPPQSYGPLSNLINKRTVAQVVYTAQAKKHLAALAGTGQSIGTMISILVILLGGLAVASMLVARFDAMGVQLAVLRALGYTRLEVAESLLFEGVLLGLAACVMGILIDVSLFPFMRWLLGSALPPPDVVSSSIWQSAPVWLAAILATTASVCLPLYKLYKQDIHRSLRN